MYEELQRKARPKPPRCILADGIKGLFGIVSPSKLLYCCSANYLHLHSSH